MIYPTIEPQRNCSKYHHHNQVHTISSDHRLISISPNNIHPSTTYHITIALPNHHLPWQHQIVINLVLIITTQFISCPVATDSLHLAQVISTYQSLATSVLCHVGRPANNLAYSPLWLLQLLSLAHIRQTCFASALHPAYSLHTPALRRVNRITNNLRTLHCICPNFPYHSQHAL